MFPTFSDETQFNARAWIKEEIKTDRDCMADPIMNQLINGEVIKITTDNASHVKINMKYLFTSSSITF